MMQQTAVKKLAHDEEGGAEDDARLVRRVFEARDAAAFRLLVDRHADRALSLAERVLLDRAEAEDAVQDAFTRLWRHAGRFDPARARFSTWFHRVVVNACLDRRRRWRDWLPLERAPERIDPAPDGAGLMEAGQRAETVRQALARLPLRQRLAVVLTFHEELSNREAAEAMGVGIKALESLLVRARRRLRRELAELKDIE